MMQKWILTCDMGHEPWTKEVMAASQDEAVSMFMADTEVMTHVQQNHPEMAGKSPEEMKATVMGMVKMAGGEGQGQAM